MWVYNHVVKYKKNSIDIYLKLLIFNVLTRVFI